LTLKTTEKNAKIILKSAQTSDGTTQRQELITEGEFYNTNGSYYITYLEQNEGMGESRVFLKITENSAIMRRMGEFKTVISYEQGKITNFVYHVPFGDIDIKIKTKKIENKLSNNGGEIKICYSLFAGEECTQNEVVFIVELIGEKK